MKDPRKRPRPTPRTRYVSPPGRLHRADDWASSIAGAEAVATRAPTQKLRLLVEYRAAGAKGLTDEEAADAAGLNNGVTCWWHRATDLRQDGLIWPHEPAEYRKGKAGVDRIVCAITDEGRAALLALGL